MNPLDALYNTVHNYPGGAEALAVRLGKRGATLSHEVRPPAGSTAKAGLLDAIKIMDFTSDLACLDAVEAHFGRIAFPLPQLGEQQGDTMAHCATLTREFGEVLAEVGSAAADGFITDNELKRLQTQWSELVSAGNALMRHFASMNGAARPVPLPVRKAA